MTDYLTRLTLRNLNSEKGIRPRVPMRFEPWKRPDIIQEKDIFKEVDRDNIKFPKQPEYDNSSPENVEIKSILRPATSNPLPASPPSRQADQLPTVKVSPVSLESEQAEKISVNPHDSEKNDPKKKIEKKNAYENNSVNEMSIPLDIAKIPEKENVSREKITQRETKNSPEKTGNIASMPNPEKKNESDKSTIRNLENVTGTPDQKNTILTKTSVRTQISGDRSTAQELELIGIPVKPTVIKKDESSVWPSLLDMARVVENQEYNRLPDKSIGYRNMKSSTGTIRMDNSNFPETTRPNPFVRSQTPRKMPVKNYPVQVTIGRIEIHAGPAEDVQKKHRPPPILTLDEYLGHNRKQGAG